MKRRDFVAYAGGTSVALSSLSAQSLAADRSSGAAIQTAASVASATANAQRAATRPLGNVLDPTYIDTRLDSRSISFENPAGERGAGGKVGHGRKSHPSYIFDPAQKVVLADIQGPGTVRHIWLTLGRLPPEIARSLRLEVFYDGLDEPSISAPVPDFFGLPHGRMAEYYSALISVNEGKGLNCDIPLPFARSLRVELTNESARHVEFYYQIDYTLERAVHEQPSYLHATFRRENPTVIGRDFVIAEGLKGPGRLLGCSVGIRVFEKEFWYGEGEVKIYRDGDEALPTYCGTGLEDYIGSGYGVGRHYGPYSGTPINVLARTVDTDVETRPIFVGFYRWHLPDPIMFSSNLRMTIQQIGYASFKTGQEAAFEAFKNSHVSADLKWIAGPGIVGAGLYERSDDYCATAFVYCTQPQSVPRYKTEDAISDIGLLPSEVRPQNMTEEQMEQLRIARKQSSGG
jgi:Protein of unknown function (DUF2961)